jgi:hypothetical protein
VEGRVDPRQQPSAAMIALAAPGERLVTIPAGVPDLTLGWGAMEWAIQYLRIPNGPNAGEPWDFTLSQVRFFLWYYAIQPDLRWIYSHAVRRLVKGAGKSPIAGVHAITELLGPVRPWYLDSSVPGGVVGKAVSMPLVQIAATSESQTANTMRMIRAMTSRKSKVTQAYRLDPGKTVIYTPDDGQLEVITSSASAAEGALVTFAVRDETEHWTPATGGEKLAQTLDRNLAKTSSRAVDTCNAWEPGADSVAENVFDTWVAQEEGRTRSENLILYDAYIASPDTDLADDESLERGIAEAYHDCHWVDLRTIKGSILDLRTPVDIGRRFYLNQPVASLKSWVTPQEWARISDTSAILKDVFEGDDIVLFFDGSRTQDATALVACHIDTGHIFCVDVWEPMAGTAHSEPEPVPVNEVDAAVDRAFERWNPVAFFADVREWESFVRTEWPRRYAERLELWAVPGGKEPQPIAWDMRTHVYDFTMACETTRGEIIAGEFAHDGDGRVARHVANARNYPNRWGTSVSKETRSSSKKIDAAVCVIGARMTRRLYLASKLEKNKKEERSGKVHSFE